MDELDRELSALVGTEPSVEFTARIRQRVASETMTAGWRGWRMPALIAASAAATMVALVVLWPEPAIDAPPRVAVSGADVTLRAVPPVPVVSPVARGGAPAADRGHGRVAVREPRREPEVLLSDSERAGIQLLFESAASGRLQLPEDMLQDLSLPIAAMESATAEGDIQ